MVLNTKLILGMLSFFFVTFFGSDLIKADLGACHWAESATPPHAAVRPGGDALAQLRRGERRAVRRPRPRASVAPRKVV